jgi:hypothetical protein
MQKIRRDEILAATRSGVAMSCVWLFSADAAADVRLGVAGDYVRGERFLVLDGLLPFGDFPETMLVLCLLSKHVSQFLNLASAMKLCSTDPESSINFYNFNRKMNPMHSGGGVYLLQDADSANHLHDDGTCTEEAPTG